MGIFLSNLFQKFVFQNFEKKSRVNNFGWKKRVGSRKINERKAKPRVGVGRFLGLTYWYINVSLPHRCGAVPAPLLSNGLK